MASSLVSRLAALPAGASLTFACALCTGASQTIPPAFRGREALPRRKGARRSMLHAACCTVTLRAQNAHQHCRVAMHIHCLPSENRVPHTASCDVLRQVDYDSDRQARHLPGADKRCSGLQEHLRGQNFSQPHSPRVRCVQGSLVDRSACASTAGPIAEVHSLAFAVFNVLQYTLYTLCLLAAYMICEYNISGHIHERGSLKHAS